MISISNRDWDLSRSCCLEFQIELDRLRSIESLATPLWIEHEKKAEPLFCNFVHALVFLWCNCIIRKYGSQQFDGEKEIGNPDY